MEEIDDILEDLDDELMNEFERRRQEKELHRLHDWLDYLSGKRSAQEIMEKNSLFSKRLAQEGTIKFAGTYENTKLSERDWEKLTMMLENPPKPNKAFKRAYRRFKDSIG